MTYEFHYHIFLTLSLIFGYLNMNPFQFNLFPKRNSPLRHETYSLILGLDL